MATLEETLKKLGLATARGVPQLATGFVDLAALPFTMTGMLKPEQAVGSTAYLTSKGLLPPEQKGLLGETTELVSSALNPATATKAALAKGGLLMAAPIAYHGSPYVFDKFDLSKIGTGEGAQAYGHGMYYAENVKEAEKFQKANSFRAFDVAEEAEKLGLNLSAGGRGELVRQALAKSDPMAAAKMLQNANASTRNLPKEKLAELISGFQKAKEGSLYKVDIPDADAATFLDWNKAISSQKQNKNVVDILNKKYGFGYDDSYTGGDLYKALTVDLIRTGKAKNEGIAQKIASEELNKIGVKGIQYQSAMTNDAGKATKNYVVFDPSLVKILERK